MTDEQIKEKEGVASLLINQQGRRPLFICFYTQNGIYSLSQGWFS